MFTVPLYSLLKDPMQPFRANDNKLAIDINKYYLHSFEPAAKWPLILNFPDKAIEFNQQKILLKKM